MEYEDEIIKEDQSIKNTFNNAIKSDVNRTKYRDSLDILTLLESCFWKESERIFAMNDLIQMSYLSRNRIIRALTPLIKSAVIIPLGDEENMNYDRIDELKFLKNPFKKGNDMAAKARLDGGWYELEPLKNKKDQVED